MALQLRRRRTVPRRLGACLTARILPYHWSPGGGPLHRRKAQDPSHHVPPVVRRPASLVWIPVPGSRRAPVPPRRLGFRRRVGHTDSRGVIRQLLQATSWVTRVARVRGRRLRRIQGHRAPCLPHCCTFLYLEQPSSSTFTSRPESAWA